MKKLYSFSRFFSIPLLLMLFACDQPASENKTEGADETEAIAETPPGSGAGTPEGYTPTEWRQLNPEQQMEVIDEILRVRARQQAEGLGGGRVVVNGAWNYTGYSFLSPDPDAAIEARMVAVDITVSGHTMHFDLDDIEIVDGASFMSYGSDPHLTPLRLSGETMKEGDVLEPAPKSSRWLLIYAFPRKTSEFHLFYWGRQLTPEPIKIEEQGWGLPFPPKQGSVE